MGQYFKPACPDTKEYLYSHAFGDGLKLMEFASGTAMISGMALLLALPAEDERGSWTGNSQLRGKWAGKRLVVTGDYADEGRFVPPEHQDINLYRYVSDAGSDISERVMRALGEVAGPGHPMALRVNRPEGANEYWYDAPKGMDAYLDVSKASELVFESYKQLHAFGWYEVGLFDEDRLRAFSEALRHIAMKYSCVPPTVSDLELKLSDDSMRVEQVNFELNGEPQKWSFPLSVKTVYEALGIV